MAQQVEDHGSQRNKLQKRTHIDACAEPSRCFRHHDEAIWRSLCDCPETSGSKKKKLSESNIDYTMKCVVLAELIDFSCSFCKPLEAKSLLNCAMAFLHNLKTEAQEKKLRSLQIALVRLESQQRLWKSVIQGFDMLKFRDFFEEWDGSESEVGGSSSEEENGSVEEFENDRGRIHESENLSKNADTLPAPPPLKDDM